jgi:hypothetical protein
MQNADGGSSVESDGRNDDRRAVVSDLVSLIEHVQASLKLIEAAIVRETPLRHEELAANVVVLDDVTPRYIKVNAAFKCRQRGAGPRPAFAAGIPGGRNRVPARRPAVECFQSRAAVDSSNQASSHRSASDRSLRPRKQFGSDYLS